MRVLGVAGLVAALAIPMAAQQQAQPPQQPQGRQQVGTAGSSATVEAIADNPERFYDQTVTVSGEVGKVHGKKAFNLKEQGILDVDDELLVLSKKPLGNVREDAVVQVRGTVKRFTKAEIERDLGITDWNEWGVGEDLFSDRAGKPVLIAESIEVRPAERK